MKASQLLESETFGSGNRNYFIDFKRSANNSDFIRISRSDRQGDHSYNKSSVVIFEEDFFLLIESFSMLFASIGRRKPYKEVMMNGFQPHKNQQPIDSQQALLRPREKMIAYGTTAMENAELLAILIGSGKGRLSACELAIAILDHVRGDLDVLGKLGVEKLCQFKGIGLNKSLTIMAALALNSRKALDCFQPGV